MSAQPNAELAWRVIDHIDAHPEQWDQGKWIGEAECGTVACFAGWTVLLSGGEITTSSESVTVPGRPNLKDLHIEQAAQRLLGLRGDIMVLHGDPFDGLLTRQELGKRVADIFGPRPEHCGYTLPHPEHDWVKIANDERPVDQDARCPGGAA